jgi:hypothetical protein
LAEEKDFLNNYTIPLIQLDPLKTILVFSHNHNSFDKRKMLSQSHPQFMKPSNKTVADFIRRPEEVRIRDFFLKDLPCLLEKYESGKPQYKPDVLSQIEQLEQERMKMAAAAATAAAPQVFLTQPDGQRVPLTLPQLVEIIQNQQQTIRDQSQLIQELQQNKMVIQRNEKEGPVALSHLQIIEFINQQQQIIELLKQRQRPPQP